MKNQKPTIELRKWENVRGHKLQGNHLNNAEKWSKNCSWIFCIWILLACFILLLGFMSYGWSGELMTGLSERLDTMGKKDNMVVCSLVMLVNLCPSFWSYLVNYAPPFGVTGSTSVHICPFELKRVLSFFIWAYLHIQPPQGPYVGMGPWAFFGQNKNDLLLHPEHQ